MNTTTKPEATILDLDSLLDRKMDEVETLPDFVTPPAGVYVLSVKKAETEKYKSKDEPNKEKLRIRMTYAIDRVVQVKDGEFPPAVGSLFSETFTATEDGVKYFKKACMGALGVKEFGADTSLRDVMEGVTGVSFEARITIRKTPGQDGAVFENINIRAVNAEPDTAGA